MMNWKFQWKRLSADEMALATSLLLGVAIYVGCHWMAAKSHLSTENLRTLKAPVVSQATVDEIVRHLEWAGIESDEAIRPELQSVEAFFSEARGNTTAYAEEMLSFDSKLRMVGEMFTNDGSYRRHVKDQFTARVLSQDGLEYLIRQTIADYLRRLDDVDAQLLVRIKADIKSLPSDAFSSGMSVTDLGVELDGAIGSTVQATQQELAAGVGLELTSYVVGEIVNQAVQQLAISTGVMSANDADGLKGMGVNLAVGLAVDQAVSELYTQSVNPVGKLAGTLAQHLDQIESAVLYGNAGSRGMVPALAGLSNQRKQIRRDAIEQALRIQLP